MKNQEQAEEIVQEVFVKLWEKFEDKDLGHEAEWLFKVTRNACYDMLRKKKKVHISYEDLNIELPDQAMTALQSLSRNETNQTVAKQMNELTDIQKEVLQLKFAEDLSYQQISQVTGMSPNHIAVFVFNTLKKFKAILKGVEYENN